MKSRFPRIPAIIFVMAMACIGPAAYAGPQTPSISTDDPLERLGPSADRWASTSLEAISILDRSRVVKGLALASTILDQRFTVTARSGFDALTKAVSPSLEEEMLEAAANVVEIAPLLAGVDLGPFYNAWASFFLDPHALGPASQSGRLAAAVLVRRAGRGEAGRAYAERQLEAVSDFIIRRDEWHRFSGDVTPAAEALAHRWLVLALEEDLPAFQKRRLGWIRQTHEKTLSRLAAKVPAAAPAVLDALSGSWLSNGARALGRRLMAENAGDSPLFFSAAMRYAAARRRERPWMEAALSRPVPRLAMNEAEWRALLARNAKDPGYIKDVGEILGRADEAAKDPATLSYTPAPNLDERGKTNALATAVGRKLGAARTAFVATGDEKRGRAFKDIIFAQLRQYEEFGDFRCYYDLNSPGPWDVVGWGPAFTDAYDLLSAAGLVSAEERERLLGAAREMGRDLAWSIGNSTLFMHNTWARWAGALGQVAAYWSDFPEAPEWRALLERTLAGIYAGINADGGWYENTIAYHLFAMDSLLAWYRAVLRLEGADLFARVFNGRTLASMFDWVVKISPPGGYLPPVNDGQRISIKGPAAHVRTAALLGRSDFLYAGGLLPYRAAADEPTPPRFAPRPPAWGSVLLPDGGFGVLRSGWRPDDFYALLKFGPHGGGHGHYDKASLYVHAFGRPWLIDPGYGLRATAKHNTVTVDGADQPAATGRLVKWAPGAALDLVSVEHDAYPQVHHRRTVFFVKPGALFVVDELTPRDAAVHAYDWYLQLNPVSGRAEPGAWAMTAGRDGLKVAFPDGDAGEKTLGPALNVNELPDNYAKMGDEQLWLRIWRGRWTKRAAGPVVFAAWIEPYRGAPPSVRVAPRNSPDGAAYEVVRNGKKMAFRAGATGFFYTAPDGRATVMR